MTSDAWSRLEALPAFVSIYVDEMYWLARETVELCQAAFAGAPPPNRPASYLRVDRDLHRNIREAINNAARIRALIEARPKQRRQSAEIFAVQERRTRWLAGLLEGIDLPTVRDPSVRHSLEHFDEQVDAVGLAGVTNGAGTTGARPGVTAILVDFALGRGGTMDQFFGDHRDLRVYLAEERVFMNAGRSIDLGALEAECAKIRDRIAALAPAVATAERGGTMPLIVGW